MSDMQCNELNIDYISTIVSGTGLFVDLLVTASHGISMGSLRLCDGCWEAEDIVRIDVSLDGLKPFVLRGIIQS